MKFKTKIIPYTLRFKRSAGTSRGVYTVHKIWYVVLSDSDNPQHWGIGECAPLPDLSCDYSDNYESILKECCTRFEQSGEIDFDKLRPYPSILFGFETALRHFESQSFKLWNTAFGNGQAGIPINGLIWMGDFDFMRQQIIEKIELGFKCIKLKIGAIDFDKELELLKNIRKQFSSDQITLRVDANGAFDPKDALEKLKQLAELDIHSIEQPIKAGQQYEMAELAAKTPIPIALDEELIGVNNLHEKLQLLETISPQYIILKPTLHGGISGANEWIEAAEKQNIGWWVTSALESNIGLNAIAQWCATLNNPLPQGLGTGGLYDNNVEMPLSVVKDFLWYNPNENTFNLNDL